MKLTTHQIIRYIEENLIPADFSWEVAIESATSSWSAQDAVDGARFLEHLAPDSTWSAEQYHGLMHHHFTGRWPSVAEVGRIRAYERYEDEKITTVRYRKVTATDEAAEAYARESIGSHLHVCEDGTVLTFDHLYNNTITEETP